MGRKKLEVMEQERKEFLEQLEVHHGCIKLACHAIGIKEASNYVKRTSERYPEFKEQYESIKAEQKIKIDDIAETGLFKKIVDGNLTAIIFYLKTRCQDRGYIERQHIVTEKDIDIVFEEVELFNGKAQTTELSDTEDVSEAASDIQ